MKPWFISIEVFFLASSSFSSFIGVSSVSWEACSSKHIAFPFFDKGTGIVPASQSLRAI